MRKLFCFLSTAMAGVVCASAVNITPAQLSKNMMPKEMLPEQGMAITKIEDAATKAARKNAKQQAPTVDDYFGYWQWSGHNWLNGVVFPNEGVMEIRKSESNPNEVLIFGFEMMSSDMGHGLKGTIDSEGVLRVPRQQVTFEGDVYYEYYGACYFQPYTVANVPDQPGYVRAVEYDGDFWFVMAQTEDGELAITSRIWQEEDEEISDEQWPNYWMNGSTVPEGGGGYYWLCGYVTAYVLEFFEFNPVEWTSVGNAEFYDAWFNPILQQPVDAYEVPLYRNTLNENRFLLHDPYGPDTPFGGGFNESGDEGYIIFDITNPNCVVFEPFVYAAKVDMGDAEEADLEDFYNYNLEGYYFFVQGSDLDDVESNLLDRDKDVSYLDNMTVWIYNPGFDLLPEGMPGQFYSWNGVDATGSIKLPAGYDAVETILGEENNATPVYYNLQGVRVNNPAKGQLVIVKKGNQTTKTIVR